MAKDLCPCGTKALYSQCCRPFHRGEREPESAEKLMRSRFSAFAKREVAYLWKTLDAEHPDRLRPALDVRRELLQACTRNKYVSLNVLSVEDAPVGGISKVTFRASVFENGKDQSFQETSAFRHDGTGWRYWRAEV